MSTARFTPPNLEADLLLTCARVHLDEWHAARLRELSSQVQSWDRLLSLAARHGLLPLLGRHMQSLDSVPAEVRERLRAHQHAVALHNLARAGELVRVLRLFDQNRIPALPFKGPALAQFAYGDLALREFGDLDLLLRPADVSRARSLLMEQGYHSQYALTQAQEAAYLRSQGQLPLEKPGRAIVELHAALAPRAFPFDLGLARMWPRRVTVALTGQPVAAPGAENLLLILCMHGAKHLWKNLGWICDVAELLRAHHALDWDQARREALRLRCERMLRLGVLLAEEVLQAPLPPEVSGEARRDATARALAGQILPRLFDAAEWVASGWESAAFHLRLRERPRDGLRFCISLFLTPTLADWKALSLAPPLAWLYFGVRPVRLLGKYLARRPSAAEA
jgi:hypothetical protein